MKIKFRTLEFFKNLAKKLSKDSGLKLSYCQEQLSILCGYKNFYELQHAGINPNAEFLTPSILLELNKEFNNL